ncbi:penicillin-binding transpeptidase domain-containing protein [Sphingomonas sediminicola]|uniref:penicillin-binding transpeptidase domain-containing protein n=1 Tax=Sphingomonas sediminicola TaxID=386874 RepID=UPI0024844EAE|nr:penicillin-binding transpeptidase domain-containing protein [Sphingomonas sediminicola]
MRHDWTAGGSGDEDGTAVHVGTPVADLLAAHGHCGGRPDRGRRLAPQPFGLARNRREREILARIREQPGPANNCPARRGWIVDRHGKPIAINRSDFRVDIIPDQLENPEATLRELSQLLSLSPDDVDRILRDLKAAHGYQPIEVAESVPFDKYAAVTVRLPELPGVNPMRGFSRFYPDGPAVAHLVGFVGTASAADYEKDKNPLLITPGFKIGKEGLEKTLEPRLRGTPGGQRVELTSRGKLVRELEPKPDRSGNTVQLTIDAGLQQYAARRMGDQSGALVAMDVSSGDMLAFVSMPAFDPNSFSDGIGRTEWKMLSEDDHIPLLNKVAQGLYPSGSTIKPAMALAFLQQGIDPNRRVHCPGGYQIGNRYFRCDAVHGSMDMHSAIERSCNTYFWATGLITDPRRQPRWSSIWVTARSSTFRSRASASAQCRTRNG